MTDKLEGFVACCNCGLPLKELTEKIKTKDKELAEAKAEIERLREALQNLFDEQNGPPLIRDEKYWRKAMDTAEKLLHPDNYTGFYKDTP